MTPEIKERIAGYIDRKVEGVKPSGLDEENFVTMVKLIKHIGFGRMIQLIQREWYLDNLPSFLKHKATKFSCALGSGFVTDSEVDYLKEDYGTNEDAEADEATGKVIQLPAPEN